MNTARSALITGASRGIGLHIARHLARQESELDHLFPLPGRLERHCTMLPALGAPRVQTVAADMSDVQSLPELVTRHQLAHDDMSALIMNVGVGTAEPISGGGSARVDKTLAVNFLAPFTLIRAALPMLRAAAARHQVHGAKVVVLASSAGVYAEPGLAGLRGLQSRRNVIDRDVEP